MWLFHSVTQSDLNPECLRWKLLEHFLHPEAHDPDPELGVVTLSSYAPFLSLHEVEAARWAVARRD